MWPHHCWIKVKDHVPWPISNTLPDVAQDTNHLLCSKRAFLVHVPPDTFLPSWVASRLMHFIYCSCTRCKNLPVSFWGSCHFFSLWRSLWISSQLAVVPVGCQLYISWGYLGPRFPTAKSQLSTSRKNNLNIEIYCNKESLCSVSSEKATKQKHAGAVISYQSKLPPLPMYVTVQSHKNIRNWGSSGSPLFSSLSLGGTFLFLPLMLQLVMVGWWPSLMPCLPVWTGSGDPFYLSR